MLHPSINPHGYFVALFDILGFEQRFGRFRLDGMLARYMKLVEFVRDHNARHQYLVDKNIFEPIWLDKGEILLHYPIGAAYASDSIIVWSPRTWKSCHSLLREGRSLETIKKIPEISWMAHPVPCDPFLDLCNELICRSLEMELPLRGAISIGDARIDGQFGIFIGQPIIDAARLESGQKLIGATFHQTFLLEQFIPKRFEVPFSKHIKPDIGVAGQPGYKSFMQMSSGLTLDWPRHWRMTRNSNPCEVVDSLDSNLEYRQTYEITRDFLLESDTRKDSHDSPSDLSVSATYKEFSEPNIFLATVFVDKDGNLERAGAPPDGAEIEIRHFENDMDRMSESPASSTRHPSD